MENELLQYGILGVLTLVLIVFAREAIKRDRKKLDRDEEFIRKAYTDGIEKQIKATGTLKEAIISEGEATRESLKTDRDQHAKDQKALFEAITNFAGEIKLIADQFRTFEDRVHELEETVKKLIKV